MHDSSTVRLNGGWVGLIVLLAASLGGLAADPEVRVSLVIPDAETHVIGDAIPLYFRFENTSRQPLAFMWEGCCRFNGKLTVTRQGSIMPATPPGQALAHMFAKAERLEPGQPKDFDTRLSDWVVLRDSGTYELRGRYQGVLPFQKPQVGRGLELWRGTSESPPLRVDLLSVADYLDQRQSRSAKSGLRVELTAPAKLLPTGQSPLRLEIRNLSSAAQQLVWPDEAQLWLVDSNNVRVASAATIEAPREVLVLPPGGAVQREIAFDSTRLEGEALGDYRIFVDLAAQAGRRVRLPSNAAPLRWELAAADVSRLLREAAVGHRTGARNAPLKLLRIYVVEIAATLAGLDLKAMSAAEATLAGQLRVAGCLKPLAPKPGLVQFDAVVPAAGGWRLDAPLATACLGGQAVPAEVQFGGLLAVRRHLGWEILVQLKPELGAPISAVARAAADFNRSRADLSTEPRAVIPVGTNRVTTVDFPGAATPANLIFRVTQRGVEYARRLPDLQAPTLALIQPPEIAREKFAELPDARALKVLLEDGKLASPRVLVMVDGRLTWGKVRELLAPLLERGTTIDLIETP